MNNLNCSNMPIGSTGFVKNVTPVLKKFDKYSDIQLECSVENANEEIPSGYRDYFLRNGYLVIKNLWNPDELYHQVPRERGQINYFGSINKFNHVPIENQVVGSLARYSHPQYKEIHSRIRKILEDILSEKLYNTYYYDRYYFKGQRLSRHRDRDACEVSVSVQISTNSSRPWSFCLQTLNGEEVSVNLENGWGLLYMGCDVDHWRDPLQSKYNFINKKIMKFFDDTYHHQIFFHYVRSNGLRSHFAWDKCK
jgi:small nuclear ribonucleoprotein (snRNP)-like protein